MTPLNEQAYIHLQNLIIKDKLSYQDIYSETKLSQELGISRTPLRDVHETFQVRSALECYCTLQIAMHGKNGDAQKLFNELDSIVIHLKRILNSTKSMEEFCNYDFLFHTKIIEFMNNEQFSAIFASFMYRMRRLAALSLAHEGRMKDTYEEHLSILDHMKSGDIDHIYEITLKHMDTPRGINLEDL